MQPESRARVPSHCGWLPRSLRDSPPFEGDRWLPPRSGPSGSSPAQPRSRPGSGGRESGRKLSPGRPVYVLL